MDREQTISKEFVHRQRGIFFSEILAAVIRPPSEIDSIMGQDAFYAPPLQPQGRVCDPIWGTLVFDVAIHTTSEETFVYTYSIYQIGTVLKIGLLFSGNLLGAMEHEKSRDNELSEHFFQDVVRFIDQDRRGESLLTEWEFCEKDLYSSWITQEKYTLGMRHLHFRALRAVCGFLQSMGVEPLTHDKPQVVPLKLSSRTTAEQVLRSNERLASAVRAHKSH